MKSLKLNRENSILMLIYALAFIYFFSQPAIYSPDSRSYLEAMPYRRLGYVLFLKFFNTIFNGVLFDYVVVIFQLLFSFLSIHIFYNKIVKTFALKAIFKLFIVSILLFPLFKPLEVANNICSEAITYPLYLIFLAFSIDFIKHERKKSFLILIITCLFLNLTRGQFITISVVLALVYFLKNRTQILKKTYLLRLFVLLTLPFISNLLDKSYHKLKDDKFMSTPFGYVNIATAAFFVSDKEDVKLFTDEGSKTIFNLAYNKLNEKKLLMNNQNSQLFNDHYHFFHNNLPEICNHTIYKLGRDYFFKKNVLEDDKKHFVEASYQVNKTLGNISKVLIKNNLYKWSNLFYENISHAFASKTLFFLMVLISIFSLIKALLKQNIEYLLLFMCSALTLSNAILVCIATHSIMRYLFYNYVLIALCFILLFKILKNEYKA